MKSNVEVTLWRTTVRWPWSGLDLPLGVELNATVSGRRRYYISCPFEPKSIREQVSTAATTRKPPPYVPTPDILRLDVRAGVSRRVILRSHHGFPVNSGVICKRNGIREFIDCIHAGED